MFYIKKINRLAIFCLVLVIFLTGCSTLFSEKNEEKADSTIPTPTLRKDKFDASLSSSLPQNAAKDEENNDEKYLNIEDLYAEFSPDFIVFDTFFKSSLPNKAYRIYTKNINKKIESLKVASAKIKYQKGRIYSKEKVSTRKRKVKKEWIWGSKKEKMRDYYKFFKKSGSIYEYKIIFNPVETNTSEENIEDEEKEDKVAKTNQSIVVFMYQIKKEEAMYIIDPDIFIDSIL